MALAQELGKSPRGGADVWDDGPAGLVLTAEAFAVDPGPGRPALTSRLTRLSAAGIPERYRAFTSKESPASAALDAQLPALGGSFAATYSDVLSLAGSLPTLASTLAGAVAPPDFDHTLEAALAPLGGTITGTHTAPAFDHTLAGLLGPLQGGISATAFAPGIDATLSGALPKLSGDVAGTSTPPNFDAALVGTLGPLASTLAGTHTAPQFDVALDGALPALAGAVAVLTGAYAFELGGSFAALSGRLGDAPRGMLDGRCVEPALAAFLAEMVLDGRAGETLIDGRGLELELAGVIVDEEMEPA